MAEALPLQDWINRLPVEGSLEQLHQADGTTQPSPTAVPHEAYAQSLPSSVTSSYDSGTDGSIPPPQPENRIHGSLNGSLNGSLSQLQNAGNAGGSQPVHDAASAAHIPLPESDTMGDPSIDADSNAPTLLARHRRTSGRRKTYWQHIARLQRCLPHLHSLNPAHRRFTTRGSIVCIDYLRNVQPYHLKYHFVMDDYQDTDALSSRMLELRAISDPQTLTRFILVEDLCPALIESLGISFGIDPEFFAEHLNRSGYAGVDYEDDTPDQWDTCFLRKPYASMKWYRVVQQNPRVTRWLQTPNSILNRRLVTKTNRIRKVQGGIQWLDPAYNIDNTRNEQQKEHQAVAGTNIFRRSWSLSTRPLTKQERLEDPGKWYHRDNKFRLKEGTSAVEALEEHHTPHENASWKDHAIPTAWEEKASCYRYDGSAVPIFIILLDPLPLINDHQFRVRRGRQARQQPSSRAPEKTTPIEMSFPRISRAPVLLPQDKFRATREDLDRFQAATQRVKPTIEAVLDWASLGQAIESNGVVMDPIRAILTVISIDTDTLLQNLELALDEISQDSLDDYLITRQLQDWRRLLSEFDIQIPSIGDGLRKFLRYTFPPDPQQQPPLVQSNDDLLARLPTQVREITHHVEQEIGKLHKRLETAYTALRADMQFAESRRSIAEAKAVGKLTELAFIFIPLSFTCSLFSMSISELKDGVPVWTFVVTALIIGLISYGVRILFTSDFLTESSRKALEEFWARRDVQRGQSAPTLTLVVLTVREVWRTVGAKYTSYTLFLLGMSSLLVVPTALMWTSARLDVGLNAAITVFFFFGGLGCVWFVVALSLDDWTLGLLPPPRYSNHNESDTSEEE